MITIRDPAPRRTTMNFEFEILYFFGPSVKSRNFGGNGSTSYFDPFKSIPKFEFFELHTFSKKSSFLVRIYANFNMFCYSSLV